MCDGPVPLQTLLEGEPSMWHACVGLDVLDGMHTLRHLSALLLESVLNISHVSMHASHAICTLWFRGIPVYSCMQRCATGQTLTVVWTFAISQFAPRQVKVANCYAKLESRDYFAFAGNTAH